tara:strand:+ start:32118 stop:33557 length:1440 start_codon:yes stop_codon:yes gene_type:complete
MKINTTRRKFLGASSLVPLTCLSGPVTAAKQSPRKPNILFIMADDLGYADLSCYGRRDYQTPRIDRLAEDGLRFTSAYANSAVCSATRTALMTGNYQYRYSVGLEEPLAFGNIGLEPSLPTLSSLLQEHGYSTMLIGKWHLGRLPDYGPLQSGYDHFWGFRNGGIDYFSHSAGGNHDLWDGDTSVYQTGYLTDLLGDRAVSTLQQLGQSSRPFLMSLHFSAPHWPWEGLDSEEESARLSASSNPLTLAHFDGGSMAIYAEMVERLDYQVGRVLDELVRQGLDENTIVIFTSDNGGERFSDTYPFTGRKTELLEGGLRIPAIVKWPGKAAPKTTSDTPVMTMDWLPTFLSAAGIEAPDGVSFDGTDIGPVIAQDGSIADRTLFWRYKNLDQRAVRDGNWKYLRIAGNEFLFDIAADPMERANLKDRRPEIFARLKAEYEAWDADMLPFNPNSFTHGFNGSELADHFGLPAEDTLIPPATE